MRDELDLDSMDVLALIEGVAEAVGVDIPEHDYPMLTTLTEFADYVAVRTDAQ
jgi:acyl carrier protein